jgi:hypothetical protein
MELTLTNEEQLELKEAIHQYALDSNNPSFSLGRSLNEWHSLVNSVNNGYPLGIYDYTNELTSRDILQRFLNSLSGGLREKVGQQIEVLDSTFRNCTEETKLVLAGTRKSNEDMDWWWRRVPSRLEGELKEDMQSLPKAQ